GKDGHRSERHGRDRHGSDERIGRALVGGDGWPGGEAGWRSHYSRGQSDSRWKAQTRSLARAGSWSRARRGRSDRPWPRGSELVFEIDVGKASLRASAEDLVISESVVARLVSSAAVSVHDSAKIRRQPTRSGSAPQSGSARLGLAAKLHVRVRIGSVGTLR